MVKSDSNVRRNFVIHRYVTQNDDGSFRYDIMKDGIYNEINPILP